MERMMVEGTNVARDEIRALLVEDEEPDAELLQAALARSEEDKLVVTHVRSLETTLDALATAEFDVILLDLGLPDSTGLETLTRVLQATKSPIIVITAAAQEDAALAAVRAGAQDYLHKGKPAGIPLLRTIKYAIERRRLDAERRQHLVARQLVRQVIRKLTQETSTASIRRDLGQKPNGLLLGSLALHHGAQCCYHVSFKKFPNSRFPSFVRIVACTITSENGTSSINSSPENTIRATHKLIISRAVESTEVG
jgi:DNA-binding response OmpR family regulator